MLKLLLCSVMVFLVGCNSSGGGSKSQGLSEPVDEFIGEEVSYYRFQIIPSGPALIPNTAYTDFYLPEFKTEAREQVFSEQDELVLYGEDALWQVTKRDGPPVTLRLYHRDELIEEVLMDENDITYTLRHNM